MSVLATWHAAHSRIFVPYVPRHRSPLAPNQIEVAYLPRHDDTVPVLREWLALAGGIA